ncbi:MAG TPA: outer membrane beta-barrel protein [Gemmatimonadaceae bacterium]|nr:outer membrane beta-barrel protein [Gemmatimonadaceae bacterium]
MRRAVLFLLPAILLVPCFAAGQSTANSTVEDIRKDARGHLGPFYLTPGIQLKELGVDTNVFNSSDDPQSDFMFNVSPKLNVWLPIARRALLTTTVATDLVWYANYGSERSVDPQLTARADVFLHRLTVFAENAYLNTRQRQNFEIDLRSRHLENNFSAGAVYQLTPKFSLQAAGRRSIVEYDADAPLFFGTDLRESLNRRTTGFSLTAKHKLSPLTSLLLSAERSADRFTFASQRDSNGLRIAPGVEFKPKALISGVASLGFRRFTPEHPEALPAFTGVVGNVGLSYTLLGATTFGISFNRDVQYSFEPLQPYFVSTSTGASIRRAIGRRFDAIASVDRHRYAYRDLNTVLAVSTQARQRVDTTWNYGGNLGYRLNRTTRMGFGASYWQRDSTTVNFRDYDGLRIGTTVTYGF